MNLDITDFFNTVMPEDYSASQAELGPNAARITWHAAKEADFILLDTEDKRAEFSAFLQGAGFSETAILDDDLNALCIQWISGDMREAGLTSNSDAEDWANYEAAAKEGEVSSSLYKDADGKVYFYVGC